MDNKNMEYVVLRHVIGLFKKGMSGLDCMEMLADFHEYIQAGNMEWVIKEYNKIMSLKEKDIKDINGVIKNGYAEVD